MTKETLKVTSMLEKIFRKSVDNHAYLLHSSNKDELLSILQEQKEKNKNGIEIVVFETSQFTIDDSREFALTAQTHAIGDTKYIVLSALELTHEAEHSLLKLFEEPPKGVHFFLLTSRPHSLLPTLRSRCLIIDRNGLARTVLASNKFINLTLKDKYDFIAKLIKGHDDDEDSISLRQEVEKIFDNIILTLYKEKEKSDVMDKIEKLIELKKYIHNRGSSLKQLLETASIISS